MNILFVDWLMSGINSYRWDLQFLYKRLDDPQIEVEDLAALERIQTFVQKWKNNYTYLQDSKVLREALDEYESIRADYLYGTYSSLYFWLQSVLSQGADIKALSNKSDQFSDEMMIQLQFFELSLGKVLPENQKKFLHDESLAPYHYFLEMIFVNASFDLSEKEEKLISLLAKPSLYNRTKMVTDFFSRESAEIEDASGGRKSLTYEEILTSFSSPDKVLRDNALKAYQKMIIKHRDPAEVEINTVMQYKQITDTLRGYQSPWHSRLVADQIDQSVLDALIQATVASHDVANDFYMLKAELLGVEKFDYHERSVRYTADVEDETYTFDQAVKMFHEVLQKVDTDLADYFMEYLHQGKIDVFPQKGKQGGAFNVLLCKRFGSLVMLNYTETFRDVLTLAHEMGHAFHSWLSVKHQHALDVSYSMFTAEVASILMEELVFAKLLETADDEKKLVLLMHALGGKVASTFRQIACLRFEMKIHELYREKGYVPQEDLAENFSTILSEYLGPAFDQSYFFGDEWIDWPHIRNFFYVYTYASGQLLADALCTRVTCDSSFFAEISKHFLSAGGSASPKDIFATMGIAIDDKAIRELGYDSMRTLLVKTKELAKKLGKIA